MSLPRWLQTTRASHGRLTSPTPSNASSPAYLARVRRAGGRRMIVSRLRPPRIERDATVRTVIGRSVPAPARHEAASPLSEYSADVPATPGTRKPHCKSDADDEHYGGNAFGQSAGLLGQRQQWRESETQKDHGAQDCIRPKHPTLQSVSDRFTHGLSGPRIVMARDPIAFGSVAALEALAIHDDTGARRPRVLRPVLGDVAHHRASDRRRCAPTEQALALQLTGRTKLPDAPPRGDLRRRWQA